MTDEKIRAAVEIAQKAIDLAHRVPPEGLRKSKELMTLAHAVVELSAELTALKDKARWRKQSEEPAPEGEEVLIRYTDYDDGNYYDIVKMEDMYDPDGELAYPLMWWRPLDLPEMGEAK